MTITSHKPLLALTVRQPWAWAIAHGHKRIENRGWEPQMLKVGDRFAIHAGAHQPELTDWQMMRGSVARSAGGDGRVPGLNVPALDAAPQEYARGAVVAVALFVGVVHHRLQLEEHQRVWWVGPKAWLLANVRRLHTPVACSGAQGLWELPGEVLFKVLQQLGESKSVVSE